MNCIWKFDQQWYQSCKNYKYILILKPGTLKENTNNYYFLLQFTRNQQHESFDLDQYLDLMINLTMLLNQILIKLKVIKFPCFWKAMHLMSDLTIELSLSFWEDSANDCFINFLVAPLHLKQNPLITSHFNKETKHNNSISPCILFWNFYVCSGLIRCTRSIILYRQYRW